MVAVNSSFRERAADETMRAREAAIARASNPSRVEGPGYPDKATFSLVDISAHIELVLWADEPEGHIIQLFTKPRTGSSRNTPRTKVPVQVRP